MTLLTDPIFSDEEAARAHFEAIRWPNGPICPHCGTVNESTLVKGKSHRPGMYQCNACRKPYTVEVGSVMEASHIKLHKWALAFHLMAASKKGVSAHQLHRMLGITYKSAWFLEHRIREAMTDTDPSPMGGEGKIVEADETHTGGKAEVFSNSKGWRTRFGKPPGATILTLVERNGGARSKVLTDDFTAKDVHKIVLDNIDHASRLMTDESKMYPTAGRQFTSHERVNHGNKEYARGDVTTNTVEGFFGIFKRGMKGIYQHCGRQHLHRYIAEFDFRYSNRAALGVDDTVRSERAIKGAGGKRLTYNQSRSRQAA